jgi:hypothetical protein
MTKLERWLELLTAERDRRQRAAGTDGGARERFFDQLREIRARLLAAPGYVEPTPAEKAQNIERLDRFFREFRERQGRN